jgi:hypothetical protein
MKNNHRSYSSSHRNRPYNSNSSRIGAPNLNGVIGDIDVIPNYRNRIRNDAFSEKKNYYNELFSERVYEEGQEPISLAPSDLDEIHRKITHTKNKSGKIYTQTYTSYINVDSSQRQLTSTNIYDENLYSLPPYPIHFVNGSSIITIDLPEHPFEVDDRIVLNNVISKNVVLNNVLMVKKNSLYVRVLHENHGLSLYGLYDPSNSSDFTQINYVEALPSTFGQNDVIPDSVNNFYILKINATTDLTIQLSNILGSDYSRTLIGNIPINYLNRRQTVYLLFNKIGNEFILDPNSYLIMLQKKSTINYQDGVSYITGPTGKPTQTIATNNTYIKYFNLFGIPLNYLNSGTPINEFRKYPYMTVLSITDNSFTVDTNYPAIVDPVSTYSFYAITDTIDTDFDVQSLIGTPIGGGSQIYARRIIDILPGYPNPNNYAIQLEKTYRNVIQARIISSAFPNSQFIVNNQTVDFVNNRLYWRNLVDGNWIYYLEITPGNYTATQLENAIKKAFDSTIRYQYTIEYAAGIYPQIIERSTPIDNDRYDIDGYYKYHIVDVSISEVTNIVSFKSFRELVQQDKLSSFCNQNQTRNNNLLNLEVIRNIENNIINNIENNPGNNPQAIIELNRIRNLDDTPTQRNLIQLNSILRGAHHCAHDYCSCKQTSCNDILHPVLTIPDNVLILTMAENLAINFGSATTPSNLVGQGVYPTGTGVVPQYIIPFNPDNEILFIYLTPDSHMRVNNRFPYVYYNLYRFDQYVYPSSVITNGITVMKTILDRTRAILFNFFRKKGIYPNLISHHELNSVNTPVVLTNFTYNYLTHEVYLSNHFLKPGDLIVTDQFIHPLFVNQIYVYEVINIIDSERFIVIRYDHGTKYKFIYDSLIINFNSRPLLPEDSYYWLDQISASTQLGPPINPLSPLNNNTLSFTAIQPSAEHKHIMIVNHPNHELHVNDTIIINQSGPVNRVPASAINTSHVITRIIDDNHYEVLLGTYLPLPMQNPPSINTVSITYPDTFQMFFSYVDTLGGLLSFNKVGEEVAITPYRHVIKNTDPYAYDYDYQTLGSEYEIKLKAINLKGYDYFYISSPEFPTYDNTKPVPNVFTKIRWFDDLGDTVYDSFVPVVCVFDTPLSQLTTLNFSMYHPDGRLVHFNGLEHSFTIEIVEIYSQPEETNVNTRLNAEVLVTRV